MSFTRPSSTAGLFLWCCAALLLILAYVTHTSATDVIRFDQNSRLDSDNIYDILEDEQLFIVDKKLSKNQHKKPPVPTRISNSSSLSSQSSSSSSSSSASSSIASPSRQAEKVSAGASTLKPRTNTTPTLHHTGITSHAGAAHDWELEEELEDDFLIFSQDREYVDRAERRRREAEEDLARRVRRQTTVQGSGANFVDVEMTTQVPWNTNFQNPNSNDYKTLETQATTAIQTELNSMVQSVTVTVTGFRQSSVRGQGSTVILFMVEFPNGDVDRRALAVELLNFRSNGFTFSGLNYDVLIDPDIEDDTTTLKASTCYLCETYQRCSQNNVSLDWSCTTSSNDFFPFGEAQGDNRMEPSNRRRRSVETRSPVPIPVADQSVNSIYVSLNGLLSFGETYTSFTPRPLPRNFRDQLGNRRPRQLVCGYWSNMQLSRSDSRARVWYHAYEKTSSNTVAETTVLQAARDAAQLYGSKPGFDPSFVLIATYEDMPPDPANPDTTERVNFQMVVMSDGACTYAMVVFAQGGMQWNPSTRRNVIIGYLSETLNIETSRPDQIIGNTNRPGVWFFTLGELPEQQINPEQECLNWYYSNLNSRNFYRTIDSLLPSCPCSYLVALLSNRLVPESLQGDTICFVTAPFFGQYGKRCCYRAPGVFERNRPDAGSFLLHHPLLDPQQHYVSDTLPKQWCCEQSNLCALYYDVRPMGTCRRFIILILAVGRGDPHVGTLDGQQFAFNAIGEYIVMRVANPSTNFELQGRTCQATSSSGEPVRASVFCAFVAKGNNSDILQVELSRSKDEMVVLLNEQDLTTMFRDEGNSFQRTESGLVLRRTNDTLRVSFSEGVSLNITVAFRLLTLEVAMDGSINNAVVSGLLGNMDGIASNDFIFPNGTVLPNTTSERDLLEYGKTWAVSDATSLFTYPPGLNTASYTNDSFDPIFLDEVGAQRRAEAEAACGGSDDIGCIFDYIATNDTALALGTKQSSQQATLNKDVASNKIPELTGPSQLNVILNKQTNFSLNATDPDDGNTPQYVIVSQPSTGFSFDNNTQTGQWTPSSNQSSKLEFVVQDNSGASSELLQIRIVQCSGCNWNGECLFNETRPQTTVDESFQLAVCECDLYHSGDDCEDDLDACLDEPCPEGTTCTDLTVAEHQAAGANSTGYNCSSCPAGFVQATSEDGRYTCNDVDECQATVAVCDQNCTNIEGSFLCSCLPGYRLDPATNTNCKDINECEEKTDGCEQLCVNNDGSFTCTCLPGFSLNTTTLSTCDKDPAQDPCATLSHSCSYACQNDSGSAVCVCPKGRTLAADGVTCQDVDECSQNLCSQNCDNTDGSYICSCLPGYTLDDDKVTCTPCPANRYGEGCNSTCECRGRGTCDAVRGCVCDAGWTGVGCTVDVDECATQANVCPPAQLCSNTNGSFACVCPTGFTQVNVTQCVDIDECQTPTLNNCAQTCLNTAGSYVCSCNPGYVYVASNNSCVDIDECVTGTDRCEQVCENFQGSVNCVCRQGFLLNDDRKTCTKEQDPCEALSGTKNCSYGCEVVGGQAQCYCQAGYELAVDGESCVDIDECSNSTANRCSQQCSNTPGTYTCSCSTGFYLDNDGRTCTVCDAYHWGDNCANDCNCNPLGSQRCDAVTGCVCKTGWLGSTCSDDRDECQSSPCQANAVCTNTQGSFSCDCAAGYADSGSGCQDVNECDSTPCDQTCNNTIGSYVCSCADGFTSQGDSCNDIDECVTKPCDQVCRNTIGGFACECNAGFSLNRTTRNTCDAETACNNSSNTCEQGCGVVNGTDECFCFAGYTKNATNTSVCDDIDECQTNPCVNGTCSNIAGGFTCSCAPGTQLLSDGITCEVCPQGKYGTSCSNDCNCNATTTQNCDAVSGTCNCKNGWTGSDCNTNVDECTQNAAICSSVSNSACVDTQGSYRCNCNRGFFASGGLCVPCDDTHYGDQCSQLCSCEQANTIDCNDIDGTCTCKSTWSGVNCSVDVDECLNASTCSATQNEVCRNTNGSHQCDCANGYARPTPTDSCTDVDECQYSGLNTCNLTVENCVNTQGSFRCDCKTGYTNVSGSCSDVNECQSPGLNNCNERQDCLNTVGSFNCSCKSGYTQIAGPLCIDINECDQATTNNCTAKEDCVNTVGSFTCQCKQGYTRDPSGVCAATYDNTTVIFTLDMTNSSSLDDVNSSYYVNLASTIRQALLNFFRASLGAPFHDVIIVALRSGSVIVESQLQIDGSQTANPQGYAAKGIEDLLTAGSLNVNGTDTSINSAVVNGTTLTQTTSLCDAFNALTTCPANQVCRADSAGVPSCSPVDSGDDDNYKLIIGLGVGIPLFFIVAVIIAVLIYNCVKKRKNTAASTQIAEASEHRFPSIFAGQLATKGSWGAAHRYQMYSPDQMSVSHESESSGEGQLLKGRRQGRSDFQDSAWYDNRGASAMPSPRRDARDAPTEGATSNFSWEYMFRLLAPYRGGFEIQRPNVDPSPNPAYTPRSRGPKPDSMA